MKILSLFTVLFFGLCVCSFGQTLTEKTIKVWGNCGMCKSTIEKAAKKAGAANASWNEDSKMLTVSFDEGKTSANKIQQKVAKSGYDTQDFVAPDKAYNALHGCCKYDRKEAEPTSTPAAVQHR